MPTTSTFLNGQSLVSSALTPEAIVGIFQPIIAQIFGLDPAASPNTAYGAVRVAWQQEGQPSWGIGEDVCVIRATLEDDPYSRVRDELYAPRDSVSQTRTMGLTRVWGVAATLYGPNCFDRARLILSAMDLDWTHDALAQSNLYVLPDWKQPVYAPENFQGQWWKRADLELKFNELVTETITADNAAGVDVTILSDTGLSTEFTIETPQEGQ